MDYTEITTTAFSYSDREDLEVRDRVGAFLRIVEARINRFLKTLEMQVRASIVTTLDKEYYAFPSGFNGLVDIELRTDDASRIRRTLEYTVPEAINTLADSLRTIPSGKVYYTIIANQLQIIPPQDNMLLEVVYYQSVAPLTITEPTNWLADTNPDCYVFGLMAEISSFVKDRELTELWNARFKESLEEIRLNNAKKRWSGPSLQVKLG